MNYSVNEAMTEGTQPLVVTMRVSIIEGSVARIDGIGRSHKDSVGDAERFDFQAFSI